MSRRQIDIDVIAIYNPILKLELEGVIVIAKIGKIRRRRTFIFVPSSQGP